MCEIMEKYIAKAVAETAIKVTIENYCDLNQPKPDII